MQSRRHSLLESVIKAAAPDLLEALQRARDELCGGREAIDKDAAIKQARAAIAKATGDTL